MSIEIAALLRVGACGVLPFVNTWEGVGSPDAGETGETGVNCGESPNGGR